MKNKKKKIEEMKILNFPQIIYITVRFAIGNNSNGEIISFKLKYFSFSLKLGWCRARNFSMIFLWFLKDIKYNTVQVTLFKTAEAKTFKKNRS